MSISYKCMYLLFNIAIATYTAAIRISEEVQIDVL